MINTKRPAPFVLLSTNHGTLIVNRNDYHQTPKSGTYGVGYQLMTTSAFDPEEIKIALDLLKLRQDFHGNGVMALDCGANIGVHTVEWAKFMHGWGHVVAIEAQERIFYALAGNIAINNCFNAQAIYAAVSDQPGTLNIPEPNYMEPGSFGSFELKQKATNEFIGQTIDYSKTRAVNQITIDALNLRRLDFIKMDIEGMEMEALHGANKTITSHHPIIMIEVIKTNQQQLRNWLTERQYRIFPIGINALAIHESDPVMQKIRIEPPVTKA